MLFVSWFSLVQSVFSAPLPRRTNRYQRYIILLKRQLKKSPNNARLHTILGRLYQRSGRYDEALKEYRRALQLKPHYSHAIVGRAFIWMRQGHLKRAKRSLNVVLSKSPKHAPALAALSEYYRFLAKKESVPKTQQKHLKKAIHLLKQAISYSSSSHKYNFRLGLIYLGLGKYSLARVQFVSAITQRPFHPCYRLALHIAESFLVKSKAIYLKLAKEKGQCHHPLLSKMASKVAIALAIRLTQKMKEKAEAIAFFGKALQTFPKSERGHIFFSYLLVKHGHCKEGRAVLRRLLTFAPHNKTAHRLLGDKTLFRCR